MKRMWTMIGICSAALVLLALGILPGTRPSRGSRYSRRVEKDFFSLDMKPLNCTMEEVFSLNRGDAVDVSIVRVSGEMMISIGVKDRKAVYEGRNPELSSFRVTIPEDGDYLLSVSGNQAEGSISFQNRPNRKSIISPRFYML